MIRRSSLSTYIWIGGSGLDIRSKARTLPQPELDPAKLPKWSYDGSSTDQAPGDDSEVILYPQDPFRRGNNILVICDAYTPTGEPIPFNKRHNAAKILATLTSLAKSPACLYAGINIGRVNAEAMPGQWEFQVGPCVGIGAGDQTWAARYILERITEIAGVILSFDPKPIPGDWNGAGAHTNYSTKSMRSAGGIDVIKKAIEKLSLRHKEHIAAYGEGNERRLTGRHETADISSFSWQGVANRGASVRVGRGTERDGKGYF
ncbi:Glutamine synthetase, type III [Parasponia andersonii]|uniref:Glutamine synthetase n=1 Tax=Parasponia andersonii TaxID=3476 RepID=A0A2P5AKK1_PARAD|nr:Glutamine synthetase, type III [Parasponia andersonii]